MRERISLVHLGDTSGYDPETLKVKDRTLSAPAFKALREDRLTTTLDLLPLEVRNVISRFSQLDLRWTSPWTFKTLDPFASRLASPGLHVSYRAESLSDEQSSICSLLRAFALYDCELLEALRLKPESPSEGYVFQTLESLDGLVEKLQAVVCEGDDPICQEKTHRLLTASNLELIYDAVTQNVKLSAFWPLDNQAVSISPSQARRTEVGIFFEGSVLNPGPHSLGLSGSLTVLDGQDKTSYTSFSFHSRHRLSDSAFSATFLAPTGLHPTLKLSISSNQIPIKDGDCKPFAHLTLPKSIFADRYQLDDELFMASKNLTVLKHMSSPVDLEAPAYTTKVWGSTMLIELAPPNNDDDGGGQPWSAEIPLHLRYLEPSTTGTRDIQVPYPVIFWACSANDEADINFGNNPFDRTGLIYDSHFDEGTVFWHVQPRPDATTNVNGRLLNTITVPVLKQGGATEWIAFGTTAAIALGFAWLLWKLFAAAFLSSSGSDTETKATTKKGQ